MYFFVLHFRKASREIFEDYKTLCEGRYECAKCVDIAALFLIKAIHHPPKHLYFQNDTPSFLKILNSYILNTV